MITATISDGKNAITIAEVSNSDRFVVSIGGKSNFTVEEESLLALHLLVRQLPEMATILKSLAEQNKNLL